MSTPKFETVKKYMKGQDELAVKKFYEKYSAEGWMIANRPIVNWRFLADEFVKGLLVNKELWKL